MGSVVDGLISIAPPASPAQDAFDVRLQLRLHAYDGSPAHELLSRHRNLRYPYRCRFGVADLTINKGVFCPTLTNVSSLLLKPLRFRAGHRVLDVFAGSGAFGINAALHGANVVTVDISSTAVACTVENALLNKVADRVDARKGTMQACLSEDEAFDLIIANPPLLPGEQPDELSASLFDPGLQATIDFISDVGVHLKPRGYGYFVTSNVIESCGYNVERLAAENGLTSKTVDELDVGYEVYRVHEFRHK